VGLSKQNRLKHWRDFRTVYRRGKRVHGKNLVLVVYQNGESPTQVGISISRKVSKKAVIRNRIKRRIRHACRELLPQTDLSLQIIIIVRHCAVQCEYEIFLRELEKLLIQAEVFHGY
jgi:ribonuclease P protein component